MNCIKRTFFNEENTTQTILPKLEVGIPILDFSQMTEEAKSKQLEKLRFDESEIPLDIFTGPLCRFKIIKLSENAHRLFMTVHHAIADGWSCGILTNDLQAIYNANVRGQKVDLPQAKQLSAYALEQASFKNSAQGKANEIFWKKQFQDDIPILDFPTDRSRPLTKTYDCDLEKITFDEELYQDLKKTAANNGTTFFFLMYSAFHTFLHRLSGQEDLVLGLVAAGQTIAGNLEDTWLSDWVTEQGFYQQGNRDFTTYTINRDVFPSANYYTSSSQSFADMARIGGIYAEPDPNSNLWYVFIYWQPQQVTNQNWRNNCRQTTNSIKNTTN